MNNDCIIYRTLFHRQEWRWLQREAKRRKLTVHELVNLLMHSYLGPGHLPLPQFYTKMEKFEEDMYSGIVNDVIRMARLAQ